MHTSFLLTSNINLGIYHLQTFQYVSTLEYRRQLNITGQYFLTVKILVDMKQMEVNRHTTELLQQFSPPNFCPPLKWHQGVPRTYFVAQVRYRKPSKMDLPYPKFCGCTFQQQHQLLFPVLSLALGSSIHWKPFFMFHLLKATTHSQFH